MIHYLKSDIDRLMYINRSNSPNCNPSKNVMRQTSFLRKRPNKVIFRAFFDKNGNKIYYYLLMS